MTTPVFVLRPEPGLSATIARGEAMGLAMHAMPLSHAEPVAWTLPESPFDGILLGSANGLRNAGEQSAGLTDLPVYAVGKATAAQASELGFDVAHTGSGGLQALLDRLPQDRPLRLLRLVGEDHVPLQAPSHVSVETRVTYRIIHRALAPADAALLSQGGIVLLHSGEVARHFAAECERKALDRSQISLAALAPRIARSASQGWKRVAVAANPDDGTLLSLAADMCH